MRLLFGLVACTTLPLQSDDVEVMELTLDLVELFVEALEILARLFLAESMEHTDEFDILMPPFFTPSWANLEQKKTKNSNLLHKKLPKTQIYCIKNDQKPKFIK